MPITTPTATADDKTGARQFPAGKELATNANGSLGKVTDITTPADKGK